MPLFVYKRNKTIFICRKYLCYENKNAKQNVRGGGCNYVIYTRRLQRPVANNSSWICSHIHSSHSRFESLILITIIWITIIIILIIQWTFTFQYMTNTDGAPENEFFYIQHTRNNCVIMGMIIIQRCSKCHLFDDNIL